LKAKRYSVERIVVADIVRKDSLVNLTPMEARQQAAATSIFELTV